MLCLVGLFVLGRSSQPATYSASSIFAQLSLVQPWQINPPLPFNFPVWSISAEWAMYLLFPLLVWICHRVGWLSLAIVALCSALAIYFLLDAGEMHRPVWNALRALPHSRWEWEYWARLDSNKTIGNGASVGLGVFALLIAMLFHQNPVITVGVHFTILFGSLPHRERQKP
jgi:peptidoglycan/LPS O-acetylase OafA/YrhL